MASKSFKAEYALIEKYKKLYSEKYGSVPNINKYKEKWAASSLIEDYGQEHVFDCLEFYFRTAKIEHPISWLFFNFDQLSDSMLSQRRDEQLRAERQKRTRIIAKEYLNGI